MARVLIKAFVEPEVVRAIDVERGLVPRSAFVADLLARHVASAVEPEPSPQERVAAEVRPFRPQRRKRPVLGA